MKHLALFALALCSLAACDSPSAPVVESPSVGAPSSAMILNDKVNIAGWVYNSCAPAEFVSVAGSVHRVVTGDIGPTGGTLKYHQNMQGVSGTGQLSGDRYNFHSNVKQEYEWTVAPATSAGEVDVRHRVIRQGSNDNLWIRQTYRWSSPPFTFELIRSEFECRG